MRWEAVAKGRREATARAASAEGVRVEEVAPQPPLEAHPSPSPGASWEEQVSMIGTAAVGFSRCCCLEPLSILSDRLPDPAVARST
jgi:hypothetical protein